MGKGVSRDCGSSSAHLAAGHPQANRGFQQYLCMNGCSGWEEGGRGGLVQANGIPAWPPAFLCDVHFQALNFTIWKMHSAKRAALALRASACQEGMEGPEESGGESGETDLERRGRGWLLSS